MECNEVDTWNCSVDCASQPCKVQAYADIGGVGVGLSPVLYSRVSSNAWPGDSRVHYHGMVCCRTAHHILHLGIRLFSRRLPSQGRF